MAASASSSEAAGFAVHGGRLGEARARFPDAPEPWIDLSTGINPWPYPAPPASAAARARLPESDEVRALETAAAGAFGLNPDTVLATAGGEAAIRLLASVLPARRVGVIEPTYGGHRQAWASVGASVEAIPADAIEKPSAELNVVVLVNPNNPDGRIVGGDVLKRLAVAMAQRDGWLIVDEAFGEVASASGLARCVGPSWPAERLIGLRSFGKFYGLPGVRLGFVTAAPGLIETLRARQGEWPISADAIAAGLAAYPDEAWRRRTRRRLTEAAAQLDELLIAAGFTIVGGTSLFRLSACKDAHARFEQLAKAGILTRPFTDNDRWLRFGLPADEHWPRLKAALMESASHD